MANKILLEVITPTHIVFSEEVDFFRLRGSEGELGILPGHIPLFTEIDIGILQFKQGDRIDIIATMGGFLEVSNNKATILTDSAELAADIDVMRAQHAKERAEAQLQAKTEIQKETDVEASLRRALIRLKAIELLKDLPKRRR